jgi:predicted metal-dependent enzyme (double-stranded beta helix superfamily)
MTAATSDGEARPLSLDRLLLELARAPVSELTCARLLDLAAGLTLDDELVARRTVFAREGYARNLVCRSPELEVLVLCWRPGQQSTIHDHAGSLNAIRVHHGRLISRLYLAAGDAAPGRGPVRLAAEQTVDAGSLIGLDRAGIHQLANLSADELVTVHLYAPPLPAVNVYSTEHDGVERLPLRYTLADDVA